jgi:ribonucleotide monophosphatase NagD (HAD superfamily)
MNTFKEDLEDGHNAEKDVLKLIQKQYPSAVIIPGYCKEMDIIVPENGKSYEVKQDFKSKYTGNLVVEIAMYGKPSALITSKAKTWVFVTHTKYIFIARDRIKDCIIENNLQFRTFVGNGDTEAKDAYLIKEDLLLPYSYKILNYE